MRLACTILAAMLPVCACSADDAAGPVNVALHGLVQHAASRHAVADDGQPQNPATRGAAFLDLGLDLAPGPRDRIAAEFRFAAGDALNQRGGIPAAGGPAYLHRRPTSSVWLSYRANHLETVAACGSVRSSPSRDNGRQGSTKAFLW